MTQKKTQKRELLTIQQQLKKLREREMELIQSYNFELQQIAIERSKIQSKCLHQNLTYNPDPSGNNDSSYTCEDCGLERRRF